MIPKFVWIWQFYYVYFLVSFIVTSKQTWGNVSFWNLLGSQLLHTNLRPLFSFSFSNVWNSIDKDVKDSKTAPRNYSSKWEVVSGTQMFTLSRILIFHLTKKLLYNSQISSLSFSEDDLHLVIGASDAIWQFPGFVQLSQLFLVSSLIVIIDK